MVIKIYIANTVVDFGPSEKLSMKTFTEKE